MSDKIRKLLAACVKAMHEVEDHGNLDHLDCCDDGGKFWYDALTNAEHFLGPNKDLPCTCSGGAAEPGCPWHDRQYEEEHPADDKEVIAKLHSDLHAAAAIMEEIRRYPRRYLDHEFQEVEQEWRGEVQARDQEIMELREQLRQSEGARDSADRAIGELINTRDYLKERLEFVDNENIRFRGALLKIAMHTTICSDFERAEKCQNIAKGELAKIG